jgi:hypothetical protein
MSRSGTPRRGGRRPGAHPQAAPPPTPVPPSSGDRLASLEGWFGDHTRTVLLTLVVLASLLRGVYFVELNSGPCILLHQWEQTDMNYFHGWGQAIAQGDVLSESVGVPMHTWHRELAAKWFATHPDVRAALERQAVLEGPGRTAEVLLWEGWTGGHQFYQDPLHAYLMGGTYALLGADPRFVIVWQLALGAVSVVLVYRITSRCFGQLAGAVAGVMALLCGPLMYYEGLLLRDSTIACATLAVVWLAQRAIDTRATIWFALLGLLLGLGVMLKSTFALLAVLVSVGVALTVRGRTGLLRPMSALIAGIVVALAPFAIRNTALGVPPLAMAGSGTLTFVASNDAGYPPTGGFFINPDQLADVLGQSGGRPIAATLDTLRRLTTGEFAALLWRRFEASWHWYEVPNNVSFYYFRLMAPVLRGLPVTFFALAPLGLVGVFIARKRWREVWPLLAVILASLVSLTVFLVLGRLRLVLLVATLPFAALAIVETIRASLAVRTASVIAVLLIGLWTGRPLPDDRPLIELNDWLTPFLVEYKFEVKAAMDAHDDGRAAAAYLAFLRLEPDFSEFERAGGGLAKSSDREVARTFAQVHEVCGQFLKSAGQVGAAEVEFKKAEMLKRLASAS